MSDRSEVAITDDLPEELKAQFTKPRKYSGGKRKSKYRPILLRLMGSHGELTTDQLLTGIYRATKKQKIMSRQALYAHLKKLRNAGLVKRVLTGRYDLTDKGRSLFSSAQKGNRS